MQYVQRLHGLAKSYKQKSIHGFSHSRYYSEKSQPQLVILLHMLCMHTSRWGIDIFSISVLEGCYLALTLQSATSACAGDSPCAWCGFPGPSCSEPRYKPCCPSYTPYNWWSWVEWAFLNKKEAIIQELHIANKSKMAIIYCMYTERLKKRKFLCRV